MMHDGEGPEGEHNMKAICWDAEGARLALRDRETHERREGLKNGRLRTGRLMGDTHGGQPWRRPFQHCIFCREAAF